MKFIDRILPAPKNGGFAMEGYWVWCGSVIQGEDSRYHMFASRWPKSLPFFDGYIQASEVVRAVSDAPEGPYRFEQIVLPARGPRFWDGSMTHNPTVHRCGDVYLLFYIGSAYHDWKECYGNIRIGLATARSVYGPWERRDTPVLEPRPGKWDSTVVTNPAPCVLSDRSILLVYRSNTAEGLRLGAALAQDYRSRFIRLSDAPVIQFEGSHFVEDPYIWQAGDHLEMLAKDWTGITGEPGAGIHASSRSMLDWELMPDPKAYTRKVTWDDGTVTVQGHLERPQLLLQDGRPTHLFLATGDGPSGFEAMKQTAMTKTWNMVMPLKDDSQQAD